MSSKVRGLASWVLLLALGAVEAAGATPRFEPACLSWNGARYQAEKYFLTMELHVGARLLDQAPVEALWPVAGRTGIAPGRRTLELDVATRGPGRRTLDGELLLDADTGGILQYASVRGPEPRYRVYRFTTSGPQRRTARPLPGEEGQPPSTWSDVDIRQRFYAAGAIAEPVLEVSTLLYLLAASGLRAPGDTLHFNGYATSADEVYAVTAAVGPQQRLPVDYREMRAGATRRRRETVPVLPIRVSGRALTPGGAAEGFEILGLSDVEFLLDPSQRVIAALRARVPTVGQVEFRLRALDVSEAIPVRCPPVP